MNNRLVGLRAYLCGAMDRVPDGGVEWRERISKTLEEYGVIPLNPCNKPINIGIEDVETREKINQFKMNGEYEKIKEYSIIRHVDLRMVDITDFTIMNLDLEVHPCGTYEEGFWGNREKKPILIHVEQGKQHAPNWLFWTFPHEHIFSTWEELITYLKHINSDDNINHHKRWMFFDLGPQTLKSLLKASEHDERLKDILDEWMENNFKHESSASDWLVSKESLYKYFPEIYDKEGNIIIK